MGELVYGIIHRFVFVLPLNINGGFCTIISGKSRSNIKTIIDQLINIVYVSYVLSFFFSASPNS